MIKMPYLALAIIICLFSLESCDFINSIINPGDSSSPTPIDVDAVMAAAVNELTVGFADGEDESGVTKDIYLTDTVSDGVAVFWTSDKESVIAVLGRMGMVIRPKSGTGDVTVSLLATMTLQDAKKTKSFELLVLQSLTDKEAVAAVKEDLDIIYAEGNSFDSVTKNIARLPATGIEGTMITWRSQNLNLITDDGKIVARPDTDTEVIMTAWISRGDMTDVKDFTLTVLQERTDEEAVAQALKKLVISYADGEDINTVTKHVLLPLFGSDETEITWESGNTELITSDGQVIRPTAQVGDTAVLLTASISKGEVSDIAEFTLTVIATPMEERPAAPKNVQAVSGDATVTLSWEAPDSTGYHNGVITPISSYKIYYSFADGFSKDNAMGQVETEDGSTLTVDIEGLINGIQYYFLTVALSSAGESDPSAQVSATPLLEENTAAAENI